MPLGFPGRELGTKKPQEVFPEARIISIVRYYFLNGGRTTIAFNSLLRI